MQCPDDRTELKAVSEGHESCVRCQGAVFTEPAFAAKWPGIREMLQPEQDQDSGAWARPRPCPNCQRVMEPLRIQKMLAWIDACSACSLLWVERADVPVLDGRLKQRLRDQKMAAVPEEDRQALASALVEADASHRKTVENMGRVRKFFDGLYTVMFFSRRK